MTTGKGGRDPHRRKLGMNGGVEIHHGVIHSLRCRVVLVVGDRNWKDFT